MNHKISASIKQFQIHMLRVDQQGAKEFIRPYVFRGFFLNMLQDVDPALAKELHDAQQIKPYAIQYRISEPEIVLTVNIFRGDVTRKLYGYLTSIEDVRVHLGKAEYVMYKAKMNETGYRDILERSKPIKGATIEFKTPTYFNSSLHDFNIKLPVPGLMIKNLAQMWNSFTNNELVVDVDELVEWATKCIEPTSFDIFTRPATLGEGRNISGVKGWIKFKIPGHATGYNRWLDCLFRLGEYSNIGGNRTAGMGVMKYEATLERANQKAAREPSPMIDDM